MPLSSSVMHSLLACVVRWRRFRWQFRSKLIGEALDEKKQQALVNDFFAKVPAEAKALSGDVTVVSAMPLSDDEQAKAKQEIGADNVTFRVDPSILGGLVVRSGDRVVDGSVRSGLERDFTAPGLSIELNELIERAG